MRGGDVRVAPRWRGSVLPAEYDPQKARTLSYSISGSELIENEPCDSSCGATILPLPSSVVAPDATARVFARSTYDFVNVFVIQMDEEGKDCTACSP